MFQLSETEWNYLQSQFATSKRRTLPFVFTEQGVSMLSAVLNSDIAIDTSIQIIKAFIQMRKIIGSHHQLLHLSQDFAKYKLETNQKFEHVFKALETPELMNKQGVFLMDKPTTLMIL